MEVKRIATRVSSRPWASRRTPWRSEARGKVLGKTISRRAGTAFFGPSVQLLENVERTRRWGQDRMEPVVREAWLVFSLNVAVGIAWLCGLGRALSELSQYWLQVLFDGSCKSWGFEELKLEQFTYGRAAPKIKAAKWKLMPSSRETNEEEERFTTNAELELDLAFHAKEMAVRLCALPGMLRLPTRFAACGVMAEAVLLIQATFTVCKKRHFFWCLLPSLPQLLELKFSFVQPPRFHADIRPANGNKLASLRLGHIIDFPMLKEKIEDALMKLMGAPHFLTLNISSLCTHDRPR